MDTTGLEIKIKEVIEPVIKAIGMELESMQLFKMPNRFILRVFVDKEGGVSLDDCEQASREIEAILDVEDPIKGSYTLEVSSPGLDRPLKKPKDFKRFSGRTARVITSMPIENQTFFIGDIIEAGDNDIVLLLQEGKRVTIAYSDISRARLVYDP